MTSGIVGIIAFAFQLAKTASKVRAAVDDIKSAPREARDLIERLMMLETTCQLISVHLEQRKALPNHSLSPSFDIISKALIQFATKAQELEQMLSTLILSLNSSNGSTWKIRGKSGAACVSHLRLVLRENKIKGLLKEVERAISLLQFVIQVDMWCAKIRPIAKRSILISATGT